MKTSPEVERWFAEKKPPIEATMRKVREIILGADREGSHPSARFMRFADPAEAKR